MYIQLYFFRTERDSPSVLITDRLHINRNMAQAPVTKKKKKRNKGLFYEEALCGFFSNDQLDDLFYILLYLYEITM